MKTTLIAAVFAVSAAVSLFGASGLASAQTPEKTVCEDNGKFVLLTIEECKAVYDRNRAKAAKQQEELRIDSQQFAERQAQQAAAQKKYDEALTEKEVAYQEAHGYKSMAFDDFVLDGQKLADSQTKVAVKGIYKKVGQMSALFPNAMSVLQQRWDEGLPLLIEDDTNRDIRRFLLHCDRDIAQRGCQITLLGYATICTVTNLAGSHDAPCIKVEDGWNVGE